MLQVVILVVLRYWREIMCSRRPLDAWLMAKALHYVYRNDAMLGAYACFQLDNSGRGDIRQYPVYELRTNRRIGHINRVPSEDPWFDRPTFNVIWI